MSVFRSGPKSWLSISILSTIWLPVFCRHSTVCCVFSGFVSWLNTDHLAHDAKLNEILDIGLIFGMKFLAEFSKGFLVFWEFQFDQFLILIEVIAAQSFQCLCISLKISWFTLGPPVVGFDTLDHNLLVTLSDHSGCNTIFRLTVLATRSCFLGCFCFASCLLLCFLNISLGLQNSLFKFLSSQTQFW